MLAAMPPASSRHHNPAPALAVAAVLTLLLYFVPQLSLIARPFTLLSTVIHELGHGLTALLLGGDLHRLAIWADGSGAAIYSASFGRLATAMTAAGGLLAPPLAALALFLASRRPASARRALGVFVALLLVCLLLWVRNAFGLLFVAGLSALLALLLWKGGPWLAQLTAAFLALQLSLAAFARADYLFTATAQTAVGLAPSDTAQMAQALLLPYWFWGGLIALASLAILALGLRSVGRALGR